MDIEKLTSQLQQDLSSAQSLAISKNNNSIEPLHILSSMLADTNSSVSNLLVSIDVNID